MKPWPNLKKEQELVLNHLQQGKNCIALLPTGFGKSLCYLAPIRNWEWKVWVLSPLVSLIQDQAIAARGMGVSAVGWSHGMGKKEKLEGEDAMAKGAISLCLFSPERFVEWEREGVLSRLLQSNGAPNLVVLDEMHCLEEWKNFRESYRGIFAGLKRIRSGGCQFLGLTATMSRAKSMEWMREFCDEVEVVSAGLGRNNIRLAVVPLESERERWTWIFSLANKVRECETTLFYASTRSEVENTYATLRMAGIDCEYFHAGISAASKKRVLQNFRSGSIRNLVSTSAFGMGIDFPRVRTVVHLDLPYSVESYWQEVGRAGRDGEKSEAILLWRRSDINRFFTLGVGEKEKYFQLWKFLLRKGCRKRGIEAFFNMQEINCNNCDECESLNDIDFSFSQRHNAKVWWTAPESEPEKWLERKFLEGSKNS